MSSDPLDRQTCIDPPTEDGWYIVVWRSCFTPSFYEALIEVRGGNVYCPGKFLPVETQGYEILEWKPYRSVEDAKTTYFWLGVLFGIMSLGAMISLSYGLYWLAN